MTQVAEYVPDLRDLRAHEHLERIAVFAPTSPRAALDALRNVFGPVLIDRLDAAMRAGASDRGTLIHGLQLSDEQGRIAEGWIEELAALLRKVRT